MEPEKEKAAMKRKKYKKQCNFYLFSLCQVFKGFNDFDFDYFLVFMQVSNLQLFLQKYENKNRVAFDEQASFNR